MRTLIALISLLCLALPLAANPPHYRVTDIGPAFNSFGQPVSVNNRGQVVGSAMGGNGKVAPSAASSIPGRVFLWQHGRRTIISPTSGYPAAYVGAINDSGQITGTLDNTTDGAIMVFDDHIFLWKQGRMRDLSGDSGFAVSEARAINQKGEIAGRARISGRPAVDDPAPAQYHAIVIRGGQTIDLGVGEVNSINDRSQVAGEFPGKVYPEAAIWDKDHLIDLGVRGVALAINNRSQVLIGEDSRQPILWQNGRSHPLPMLPQSVNDEAVSINDEGLSVGWAEFNGVKQVDHALLWRNDHVYDLNAMISRKSGWTLIQATGINAKGQIAGHGTFHGQDHVFLLTPLSMSQRGRGTRERPKGHKSSTGQRGQAGF